MSVCILKLFHNIGSCWLTNKLYKTSCAYRVVNKYFALLLLVVSLFSLFRRSVRHNSKKPAIFILQILRCTSPFLIVIRARSRSLVYLFALIHHTQKPALNRMQIVHVHNNRHSNIWLHWYSSFLFSIFPEFRYK